MTTADRPAIAAHAVAKVSSEEFRPSIEAAYEVISGIKEYADMAGVLMYKYGVRLESFDEEIILTSKDLANIILTALACGFAFGADWGESKFVEGLVIGEKS